jgi:predicted amidohydrolase YtcJ
MFVALEFTTVCNADELITVFRLKKIYTMDPGWPEATTVAVQDGRILSVGTFDDVQLSLGERPFITDETLIEKVLMPGFIETHGHPLTGAIGMTRPLLSWLPVAQPYGADVPGLKSLAEVTVKLKEYVAAEKDPSKTVLVWGFDVVAMGRHLDREFLDAISMTQPILVWDISEHFVYANTAAMTAAETTAAAAKTDGVGVGENGELNGQFRGTQAIKLILVPLIDDLLEPEVALKNMKFLADLSRKHGVTTTSEFSLGTVNIDIELQLLDQFFNNPSGTLRCVTVADGKAIRAANDRPAVFVKNLEQRNTDRQIYRGVRFIADDSFSGVAIPAETFGESESPANPSIANPGKDLLLQLLPWWDFGFHIHVETDGMAANKKSLETLSALQKHRPRFDHRFTFHNFGLANQDQVRTLKVLGGLASINPYDLYYRAELNAPRVGAERAYTAARFKTLIDAGVPVSMHSDTPFGPPKPLEWVWIAVNRLGLSGNVRGESERVTPLEAFRMVTIDAAYALGVEDRLGSVEPGKFADFTVLEDDPLSVPVETIRDIKVWGTVLGGKLLPASEIKP